MVKGLVEYIQFNIISATLTTNWFNTIPQYMVVLGFILLMSIILLLFYRTYRKYNSIDNHTNKKYNDGNRQKTTDTKSLNTYKEDKKEYEKDVSDLGIMTMPNTKTIVKITDKFIELKKRK